MGNQPSVGSGQDPQASDQVPTSGDDGTTEALVEPNMSDGTLSEGRKSSDRYSDRLSSRRSRPTLDEQRTHKLLQERVLTEAHSRLTNVQVLVGYLEPPQMLQMLQTSAPAFPLSAVTQ